MSSKAKSTLTLCYWQAPTGESCSERVQWKISTERGNTFRVCDRHLGWGLRFSGLPARVDEFEPDQTVKVKIKETKK